jgi:hypothetical protein
MKAEEVPRTKQCRTGPQTGRRLSGALQPTFSACDRQAVQQRSLCRGQAGHRPDQDHPAASASCGPDEEQKNDA